MRGNEEQNKTHSKKNFQMKEKQFNCIVIGSGIGGMSAASVLAKAGKKVLLLEQHYIFGGYTHTFKRRNYEWDVGLHYIGEVHKADSFTRKTYDYISDGQIKWTALDDVYDKAFFGQEAYEFVRGKDALKANLKKYFPQEKDQIAIDKYFELLHEVSQISNAYYAEKIMPPILSKMFGSAMQKRLLHFSDQTTLSVLSQITDNKKLIGVLTAQYGDYGLTPAKSSFYMHAMVANHYMDGAGYPVGGSASLAKHIIAVIEENGGIVKPGAKVEQIIIENNVAKGVRLKNGEKYYADTIISNTGILNTFTDLLPPSVVKEHQLEEKLKNIKPSVAHLSLNIGCKVSAESLDLPKCNYWIFPPEYDHDKNRAIFDSPDAPLPVIFASFPSAKNPEWNKKHPDTCTIEIITLVPYHWFSKWEGTKAGRRGHDYIDLKNKLSRKLLDMLFNILPRLEDKIDYYELSTPLSTQNFTNHSKGEIYGLAHNPERFRANLLRPGTPVKNLFLTGQDVFMASVTGAMMGGILTASKILKKNMFWKIQHTNHT